MVLSENTMCENLIFDQFCAFPYETDIMAKVITDKIDRKLSATLLEVVFPHIEN